MNSEKLKLDERERDFNGRAGIDSLFFLTVLRTKATYVVRAKDQYGTNPVTY
jgi:hypothetical protein